MPQRKRPRSRRNGSARKDNQRWKSIVALLVVATVAFVVADYIFSRRASASPAPASASDYTYVATPASEPSEIIRRNGMTISFNPQRHIPNWVAWELTATEAQGDEPRYDKFEKDNSVDGSADPADYRNSGYDRGHMAPAGDMKWDPEVMRQSFLMTNIVPQEPSLNRGTWRKLEEKCRKRAIRDSAIVIVCGPVNADPVSMRIGSTGVAVPERFFKVILSPYGDHPTAIGFIMPNGPTKGGMQPYAVTVDEVEAITGYDFFSALPDDIEQQVESKCNFALWSKMR